MSHIYKEYSQSELDKLNKQKSYDKLADKSTFYVIKPNIKQISGFKLGKSNMTASRLKQYSNFYDGNLNVSKLIQFKKRDPNIFQGDQPNTKFETEVKRQLRKNNVPILRGTEWFAKLEDIEKSIEQIKTKNNAKSNKSFEPVRKSTRTVSRPPSLNDIVFINYGNQIFEGRILNYNKNKGYDVYFKKDNTRAWIQLTKVNYDTQLSKVGTWKY